MLARLLLSIVLVLPASWSAGATSLDDLAEDFVTLALAFGEHDKDYVDAYFGPDALRPQAPMTLDEVLAKVSSLALQLDVYDAADAQQAHRLHLLQGQVGAMLTRIDMLRGEFLSFDDESQAVFGVVAPSHDDAYFSKLVEDVATLLPGEGDLTTRLADYRKQFVIPRDKLQTVFQRAIDECRARTQRYFTLPADESFVMEFVTDKPWSGYNWYQGDYHSLIQINVELPIYIERAVDLGCHEGYPGHHVFSSMLEQRYVREKNWLEFTVYPLYSPRSPLAEGSANYGIDMAFPGRERLAFERDVLYPLAGLDASQAEHYFQLREALSRLKYAGNLVAQRYLDGDIDGEEFVRWSMQYALSTKEKARQRLRFVEKYRSYVINYNLGRDLVAERVEHGNPTPAERWRRFEELLFQARF